MTKNVWVQPQTAVQQFVANEYVAACGDINKVYKFTCDAGGGASGNVYVESNGKDGLQTHREWIQTGDWIWEGYWQEADWDLGGYHACGITHEASTQDEFLSGYYVTRNNVANVIVWRGSNNDNTHCTTNLDMNSWPTEKS